MFKGRAMTYYGRWTYKYEIAAQKGAAAAIIIHETEPAAYPWSVVMTSWAKENFELDAPDKNMDAVAGPLLDHARCREEVAGRLRTEFRRAEKSGAHQGFPAGRVRRKAPASISSKRCVRSNRTTSSARSRAAIRS